jgi:hypothetical protein
LCGLAYRLDPVALDVRNESTLPVPDTHSIFPGSIGFDAYAALQFNNCSSTLLAFLTVR